MPSAIKAGSNTISLVCNTLSNYFSWSDSVETQHSDTTQILFISLSSIMSLTWYTDVTATAIKLVTRICAALLFAFGPNVNIHWPVDQICDHNNLVWPIVFVGSVDASGVPVCPVNVLIKHGHCKRSQSSANNDLTICTCNGAALNFLSKTIRKC